jgi:hypothetical protein
VADTTAKQPNLMKKILMFVFVAALSVASPALVQTAKADVCIPADADFDAGDCAAVGGSVGTPSGAGGGPGGPTGPVGVPIDGGLSIMLAGGAALGIRRFVAKRKK